MKVVVLHKDRAPETITLTEPLTIERGEKLNRIVTSTGAEHWFDQDGFYDGWGMQLNIPIPLEEMPTKAAMEVIDEFEKGREFPE